MKKLAISGVDIAAIVIFVLLTLGGVAGWYFLTDALTQAQQDASAANDAFQKYSADKKSHLVVSHHNQAALTSNIGILQGQLGPLISDTLQSKDDKLSTITKEDPVAWKHDLDDHVRGLNNAAKRNSVVVPQNFYFGFGRYQSQSPGDDQTAVLSKQLLGIQQIATILINAPVKSIGGIRRTYEEDKNGGDGSTDADCLTGLSYAAPGKVYTAYPFEIDFETSPENLRPIINGLIQSPYILILRSITVHSTVGTSPSTSSLDQMAGPAPDTSAAINSPGEVAQTPLTKGPQFLFGNATLQVKIRVDMIEWTAQVNPPSGAK